MARLRKLVMWFRDSVPPPNKTKRRSGSRIAREIRQAPTGRPVFAAHERDHHITTAGRRALKRSQFALPPSPEEKRRGIKGRLPIDTIERARSALARASMMHHQGHLTARQLNEVRHKVNRTFPEIHVEPIEGPRPRSPSTKG